MSSGGVSAAARHAPPHNEDTKLPEQRRRSNECSIGLISNGDIGGGDGGGTTDPWEVCSRVGVSRNRLNSARACVRACVSIYQDTLCYLVCY